MVTYHNISIYVVDNDSSDDSIDKLEQYLEHSNYSYFHTRRADLNHMLEPRDVYLLLNDENSGFAGGNNVALEYIINYAQTDYILLLNNDTIVEPDFIEQLKRKFLEYPDTGFVGIRHYYYDDRTSLQTIGGGLVDSTHGEAMALHELDRGEFDFITGSCIFMSLDVLKTVGVLSEDYFLYWEDVDYSKRAIDAGYKLRVADQGCIYHKEGASLKSANRYYYHTRNRIRYMKKFYGGSKYYKFLIYIIGYVFADIHFSDGFKEIYTARICGLIDGLFRSNKTTR